MCIMLMMREASRVWEDGHDGERRGVLGLTAGTGTGFATTTDVRRMVRRENKRSIVGILLGTRVGPYMYVVY